VNLPQNSCRAYLAQSWCLDLRIELPQDASPSQHSSSVSISSSHDVGKAATSRSYKANFHEATNINVETGGDGGCDKDERAASSPHLR
jgi:hypothetical protein